MLKESRSCRGQKAGHDGVSTFEPGWGQWDGAARRRRGSGREAAPGEVERAAGQRGGARRSSSKGAGNGLPRAREGASRRGRGWRAGLADGGARETMMRVGVGVFAVAAGRQFSAKLGGGVRQPCPRERYGRKAVVTCPGFRTGAPRACACWAAADGRLHLRALPSPAPLPSALSLITALGIASALVGHDECLPGFQRLLSARSPATAAQSVPCSAVPDTAAGPRPPQTPSARNASSEISTASPVLPPSC